VRAFERTGSIGAMAASRCAVRVFGGVRDAVNPGEEWRKSFKFGDGRGEGRGHEIG